MPGHGHTSTSARPLDGKGGTDPAAKGGKSTKRTGPSYGAPYPENSTPGFNGLIYSCSVLPSIHQTRRIRIKSPSTTTTVSLVAFHRIIFLLLIRWRLSGGPCAKLRASLSPTRPLFSHHSQAQHPKKTLPVSLCTCLLGQACPNKIRSRWLLSRRRGQRRCRNRRSCRNALMIQIPITAGLVVVSSKQCTHQLCSILSRLLIRGKKR